jgi:hypothetical protein
MTGVFGQDPEEDFDYQFDFTYLLVDLETISTYELTVPDGITVDNDSNSDTAVTFWVSGGTAGETYHITCEVTTSAAREYVSSIDITIYNK